MADRKRCCCNCRRNIRTGKPGAVTCHCEIDGHYISYVACFDGWCRRWARETKWDNEKSERVLELYGKLKPYADAEEQGRLVILPCKVGDKVRDKIADHIFTIERVELGHKAGTLFRCGNPGTDDYTAFYDFEIGKNIEILTREEAETSLKGGQDDGN